MEFDIDQVKEKYKKLKTLTKVAEYFNVGIETIRQFFIANNIEYSKRQKYDCNHAFFSNENEKSFYWAGFLAADGNIEKGRNRIKLELKLNDKNHILKFKNDIESTAEIKENVKYENRIQFKHSKYYSASIRFNSKQMTNDLKSFGVIESKSNIFFIPDNVKSHKYFKHYIRGLFDGDGCIRQNDNTSDISFCGTESCVKDIYNHLKEVLKLEYGNISRRADGLWIMRFRNFKDTKKICGYLYDNSNIFLDRKYNKAKDILNIKPRKIDISKEILIKSFNKNKQKYLHYTQLLMAKELNVSVCTIRRRMEEFAVNI